VLVSEAPVEAAAEMNTPRPPVIAMRDVTKTYGVGEVEVHALQATTLTIERRDYVAIMGASGSGKSTLMNILGCLDVPTSGRYRLAGVDVSRLDGNALADVRNRRIGFIFQSFNLIPRTTAFANVEMPLVYGRMKRPDRRSLAVRALTRVGLESRLDYFPNQLSGGQQQRVAIARAIVTNPAMILADEPTGALDSTSTAEVLAIFDELNVEGRTVVIITHEDEVARHAKRIIRLRDGLIVDDTRRAPVDGLPPRAEASLEPAS
jgi:putative ABC transport system ATP-binding protein